MKKVLIVVVAVLVVLFLVKDFIAGTVLTFGVRSFTDLSASVQRLSLGVFKSAVDVKGLKLYNPPRDYKDKVMMDMPELYINYDPGSLLTGTKHFKEIKIYLKEFTVVKNSAGKLNLDCLKPIPKKNMQKAEKEKEKQNTKFKIDVLDLKIDKVVYKDYSGTGNPTVKEYFVGINERYTNITDPKAFASLVVFKALTNTGIASLANFNLGPLRGSAADVLANATKTAVDTVTGAAGAGGDIAKDAATAATNAIKSLLPSAK